jgi:hypothetical protein
MKETAGPLGRAAPVVTQVAISITDCGVFAFNTGSKSLPDRIADSKAAPVNRICQTENGHPIDDSVPFVTVGSTGNMWLSGMSGTSGMHGSSAQFQGVESRYCRERSSLPVEILL